MVSYFHYYFTFEYLDLFMIILIIAIIAFYLSNCYYLLAMQLA